MKKGKYNMSFSTGGLFYNESLQVLSVYQKKSKDWKEVNRAVVEQNVIQARTESSTKRRAREICSRLRLLTADQLQLLTTGTYQDQQYLLWLAVCKRYRFIQEFMVQVVREKYLRMDLHLEFQDYEIFFEGKAEWHDEIEALSDSTKAKLRQVLFKIMKEAEIISSQNMIIPALLSKQVVMVVQKDSLSWISIFPVSDSDISSLIE